MDDLVEKMQTVYLKASKKHSAACGKDGCCDAGMTAALRVVLEDVKRQIVKSGNLCGYILGGWDAFAETVENSLFAHKTPEERVTIKQQGSFWIVQLDSNDNYVMGTKETAEIYRVGLISKLREEAERG